MGIYKRGSVYWYKFMWKSELVRESNKQGNDKVARQMEAAHRTSVAKGEVGIRDKKPAMTLDEFCRKRFAPWSKSSSSLKTWRDFYKVGLAAIEAYSPLANLNLSAVTTERISRLRLPRRGRGCSEHHGLLTRQEFGGDRKLSQPSTTALALGCAGAKYCSLPLRDPDWQPSRTKLLPFRNLAPRGSRNRTLALTCAKWSPRSAASRNI